MGLLGRLFGKREPKTDFARHVPVLAQASQDIELGIYWRLSKKYEVENHGVDPYTLARAVVYDLLLNENGTRSLGDFPERHADLIARELRGAVMDDAIRNALSFEYAGHLMVLGYRDGGPFSDRAEVVTERATDLGVEITNIVSLWGPRAIVNLRSFAKTFRDASL
jgi:hypothetical protein